MQSKTKGLKFVLSITISIIFSGCLFLPVEEMELMKEYVFVEKRDEESCVDSLFVLFTCAEIDTTDEGKISVKMNGLYHRRVYYDGKLIYTRVDSVRYWKNITFWGFYEGCVCQSDKEEILYDLRFGGHLPDKAFLSLSYSLWGIDKLPITGIYGGCLGELSYYDLVETRDLTRE